MWRAWLQRRSAPGRASKSAGPRKVSPEVEALELRDTPSGWYHFGHAHHRGFTIGDARYSALSGAGLYDAYQQLADQGYQRFGVVDPFTDSYGYNLYDNYGNAVGYWDSISPESTVDWSFLNW